MHPLLAASPFFRRTDLAAGGVTLLHAAVALAHPLDGGRPASAVRSVEETASGLGPDAAAYRRLFAPSSVDRRVRAAAHHAGPSRRLEGGSGRVVNALVAELESLGGTVVTGRWISALDDLPPTRTVLLDVPPRQLLLLAGDRLPRRQRRALSRFRHGPGVSKMDWALSGPVPWPADVCRRAGTVHLGGTSRRSRGASPTSRPAGTRNGRSAS